MIFLTMASEGGADDEVVLDGRDAPAKEEHFSSLFLAVLWWAVKMLATAVDKLVWLLLGGGVAGAVMDTLNTLLLGWLFSAVLILGLVKFLYDKFLRGSEEDIILNGDSVCDEIGDDYSDAIAAYDPAELQKQIRRVPTIIPAAGSVLAGSANGAAGQDADAVKWINTVMKWLYRGPNKSISAPYMTLLNEMTAQTALETGVLIEVLELLPATPSPTATNLVVDCAPNDDMAFSCDCSAELYLRLQTTRTHRDVTTESEYAGLLSPLRGRLSAAIRPHQGAATLHFDGWPEVEMELEGIRNNEVGLGEKELQEVIKEVVAISIRNMVLELNLIEDKSFPRFKRARDLPDKVIPVGYDSMVRERQTHPPVLKPKTAAVPPPPVKPRDIPVVSLKESSYLPEELAYDSVKYYSKTHNLLTQNGSDVLTASEELLIARNIHQYNHRQNSYEEFTGEIEYQPPPMTSKKHIPWDHGYVPAGFLEQVTAVAMAKVEEKSLANPMKNEAYLTLGSSDSRQSSLDEPQDISALDYIPYDSEYEEEEDADDYLERSPTKGSSYVKKLSIPVVKSDEVFIPNESERSVVSKVGEVFSSKPLLSSQSKGIEALPQSTSLGAMGLPHHPRSNFVPSLAPPVPPTAQGVLNGKRLLVKIVKATSIACDKSGVNSYTVVEMDEPNQKFTTATAKGTNSPFWDEQFLFDLSDITLELLFELYDESNCGFLGLGIVGIEELMATPSQRQIIPLQARPYEDDAVSGTLTVEFLFLDGGDLPDLTARCSGNVQQNHSPQGGLHITNATTTSYVKTPIAADAASLGTARLTAIALGDIEHTTSPTTAHHTKPTLLIHASKKPEEMEEVNQENPEQADSDDNYVVNTLQYPFPAATKDSAPQTITTTTTPPAVSVSTNRNSSTDYTTTSMDTADEAFSTEDDERGRPRGKRKNSFFGSLKKRFSRSKLRSQSVEPSVVLPKRASSPHDAPRTATVGRSVSMERTTRLKPGGLLSVPKSDARDLGGGESGGSTRSSLSETSGLSSSSTRTYINEASMLIVETMENGVIKHYLVPVSLQQRNRWRKRGTKLHVYSGHTFVAKHISSSVVCPVCSKHFNRRLGKQGYECRDCGLQTHKPCHVKTETQCANSRVNSMDLVYIQDPREERRALRNQRE